MIFLDSSYIKGLIIKRDPYEDFSNDVKSYLNEESKAINSIVIVEVLNALKKNNYRGDIKNIIKELCSVDVVDWLTKQDYKKALDKFRFYNGNINFADCTILGSMEKYGITRIVITDSDFEKIKGLCRISEIF